MKAPPHTPRSLQRGFHCTKERGERVGAPPENLLDLLSCRPRNRFASCFTSADATHLPVHTEPPVRYNGRRHARTTIGGDRKTASSFRTMKGRQQRIHGDGIVGIHCLAKTPREGFVPHERLVPLEEFGRVFAQPRLDAAVTPQDFATWSNAETVVHMAFEIFEKSAKPDLRLRRRLARGEGGAQGLRRRTGVRRRAARDGTAFRREGPTASVVAHVVTGTADPALEAINLVGETTPQAAEPPQIGDAEHKLEGDMRMVKEKVSLLVIERLHVIDEGAVIGLHVPEASSLPMSPARAGLRDGVVQFTRACIGDASNPSRARVEEVALDPCGEVRAHGPRDGAWNIPQT